MKIPAILIFALILSGCAPTDSLKFRPNMNGLYTDLSGQLKKMPSADYLSQKDAKTVLEAKELSDNVRHAGWTWMTYSEFLDYDAKCSVMKKRLSEIQNTN